MVVLLDDRVLCLIHAVSRQRSYCHEFTGPDAGCSTSIALYVCMAFLNTVIVVDATIHRPNDFASVYAVTAILAVNFSYAEGSVNSW